MISVDDALWADAPSLRWLHYLATRIAELPALVLVGTRPVDVDAGSGAQALLSAIVSAPDARLVHPRPLSTRHVAALARERLGATVSEQFAQACAVATRGNPFYLHELLADLERSGVEPTDESASQVSKVSTRTIQAHVGHRLAGVGGTCVELARAIAILGTSAESRQVAALVGVEETECASGFAALMDAGILERGFPLRFLHPIVRTAVYEQVPAATLVEGHRRAARVLAGDGAMPEEVAMHLLAAGRCDDPWEIDTLRTAARRARARGTPKAAVRYLCKALAGARGTEARAAVVAELGAAQLRAGDPGAVATLEQAVRDAPTPEERAGITLLLGRALTTSGRFQDAVALLEGLLEARDELAPETILRLKVELIAPSRLDPETLPIAKRHLAGAGPELTGARPAERLMLAHLAYDAVTCCVPSERTLDLARRALADGALLAEAGSESPAYYVAAWSLGLCDRCREADQALSAAIDAAAQTGSALGFAMATSFRASVRHRAGALADAEADARSVLDVENHNWNDLAHGFLLGVLVDQGRVEEGLALIARFGMEGDVPNTMLHQPLLYARGELRLAAGDVAQGVEDLCLAGRRAARAQNRTPAFHPWRSNAALALARLGQTEQAKALAAEELELAHTFGAARALGVALRGVGLLQSGDDGLRHLEASVAVLRDCEAILERARSIVELGAATRRQGQRRAACELLREGLELAHRCGAQPLARRASDELAAAGSRPRRPVRTGVDALTASERRVAQLAASGLTNRDIAQRLFVTLKTVEWHLGQAYGKLGIAGRRELGGVLGSDAAPAGERAALSASAG
jgi:DNA-binding CsgD family transcriptional regulator